MTVDVKDRQDAAAAEGSVALLFEVREVARALRISRSKVYMLMNDGGLRSVRIGSRRLVRRADLEAFVNSLSATS